MSTSPRRRYDHFTRADRDIIRRMGVQGHSLVEIATVLNKHRTSVWREVKRNRNEGGLYLPSHASAKLHRRRLAAKAAKRIIENDAQLEMYVEKLLKYGLSPDQVAGYMRRSHHDRLVSYRTVYRWVHRGWQSRKMLLRYRGKPRVPYGTRKDSWDSNKRHISERPQFIHKRERIGDWEGDLVHGTQDDSRHCLLTLNERSTGFCIIRKLTALDATSVAFTIVRALEDLPVETITFDNGFEFGRHQLMERKLGCRVYFTDPNSPQQRGSNENLNGLIRQYFPKGQSLAHVTQLHATDVATRLNGRPRKRYGYEAPRRLFAEQTGRSAYFVR